MKFTFMIVLAFMLGYSTLAPVDANIDGMNNDEVVADVGRDSLDSATLPRVGLALIPTIPSFTLTVPWQRARELGAVEPGDVNLDWSSFEPTPGNFVDVDNVIENTKSLENLESISLTLAPFQTSTLTVPSDLVGLEWNDQQMMSRCLDAALELLNRFEGFDVHTIAIGNEMDFLFQNDSTEWTKWQELLIFVRAGIKMRYPNTAVSTKLTVDGWLNPNAQMLLPNIDSVVATFYPIDSQFRVTSFNEWGPKLDSFLQATDELPIYMAEFGAPSSSILGSSQALQAELYLDYLGWWDAHRARIPITVFVWSHELPLVVLDGILDALGSNDRNLRAYLGSLGLRDEDDIPKTTWPLINEYLCNYNFQVQPSSCPEGSNNAGTIPPILNLLFDE